MDLVGGAGSARLHARLLADTGASVVGAATLVPDATSLVWIGSAARAFDEARAVAVASSRRVEADLVRVASALDRLAGVLEDAAAIERAWEVRVEEAEADLRRVLAAAGDGADAMWAVGAAQLELASVRAAAFREVESTLTRVEEADRACQQEVGSAVWMEPFPPAGPLPLIDVVALMSNARVEAWLASLPRHSLEHLIRTRPHLVGSSAGVGLADRYRANLVVMADFANGSLAGRIGRLERTRRLLLAVGPPMTMPLLDELRRYHKDLLRRVADGRTFLRFDPAGDGIVIEVLGDLERAPHVAVVVPGIATAQYGYEEGLGADAARLWGGEPDVAVIAWLGYDTPGSGPFGEWPLTADAIGVEHAVEGARRLGEFVAWLAATRGDAHVTVIGHSYGSVVAAIAASNGLDADGLVLAGSPGVPVHDIGSMHLRPGGTVWSWSAAGDPIDELAGLTVVSNQPVDAQGDQYLLMHGVNPMHVDFGARPLPRFDDRGHSAYFSAAGVVVLRQVIVPRDRRRPRRAG